VATSPSIAHPQSTSVFLRFGALMKRLRNALRVLLPGSMALNTLATLPVGDRDFDIYQPGTGAEM
jgi:hypothetical protein